MADAAALSHSSFALLSLIAAPAVLTNSASVLALSTSNRFLRASERLRLLAARYDESQAADKRALVVKQLVRVEKQASMLLNGLRSAYVAIGSFVSASLISVVGAGVEASPLHGAFGIFAVLALAIGIVGAGAGGMVWASINLMRATRLAMLNMSDEAELIYARERIRDAAQSAQD